MHYESFYIIRKGLGSEPNAALDMHQHDKLIHLGLKIIILVMILMVIAGVVGMVWGWFYMTLGRFHVL